MAVYFICYHSGKTGPWKKGRNGVHCQALSARVVERVTPLSHTLVFAVAVTFHSGFEEDGEIRDEALVMGRVPNARLWPPSPAHPC